MAGEKERPALCTKHQHECAHAAAKPEQLAFRMKWATRASLDSFLAGARHY